MDQVVLIISNFFVAKFYIYLDTQPGKIFGGVDDLYGVASSDFIQCGPCYEQNFQINDFQKKELISSLWFVSC